MDHTVSNDIPNYPQYQDLLNFVSTDESDASKKWIAIKSYWYQDQLYLILILMGYLHATTNNDPRIQQLGTILTILANILESDFQRIVLKSQASCKQLNTDALNQAFHDSIKLILEGSLQETCQEAGKDCTTKRLQVIKGHWETAYQILDQFGLSPVQNNASDLNRSHTASEPPIEIFENTGSSPISSPKGKQRRSSRNNIIGSNNNELESKIRQLRSDQEDLLNELKTAQQLLRQKNAELTTSQKKLESAYKEIDRTLGEGAEKTKTITELTQQHITSLEQAEQVSQEFAYLTKVLKDSETSKTNLEVKQETLLQTLKALQQENQELQEYAKQLNEERTDLWDLKQDESAEQAKQVLQELTTSRRALKDSEASKADLEATQKTLSQKLEALQQEHQELEEYVQQLNEETDNIKESNHALENQIRELKIDHTDIIKNMKQQLREYKANSRQVSEELTTSRRALKDSEASKADLEATQKTLSQKLEALQQENQALQEHAKQLNEEGTNIMRHSGTAFIKQDNSKALEILQTTVQWAIEHMPYLSWSLANYFYTLLKKSYQLVITQEAQSGLVDYKTCASSIASLHAKLQKPNHTIPLISKEWISSTINNAIEKSEAAYRPYDFYQMQKDVTQRLVFHKEIELTVHSLQENTIQLDLFYIGSDKVYSKQIEQAILSLTQALAAHAESYPDVTIEVQINKETAYAQAIIHALRAYQTIYIEKLNRPLQIDLKYTGAFDAKIMTKQKQAILPVEQDPLQAFYNLLHRQNCAISNLSVV